MQANHYKVSSFQQVPSAFLLTDVMLALNSSFGLKLLKVVCPGDTVETLAAREALRIKRLIQAIRYLWRSSTAASNKMCFNNYVNFRRQPSTQWHIAIINANPLMLGCDLNSSQAKLRQSYR